jgi:hypothetical protein
MARQKVTILTNKQINRQEDKQQEVGRTNTNTERLTYGQLTYRRSEKDRYSQTQTSNKIVNRQLMDASTEADRQMNSQAVGQLVGRTDR